MLEFYKTFEDGTRKIDAAEPGCWINAVAPTEEERNYLIEEIGVLPEFVKSSLDEEESSHIDYDDDLDRHWSLSTIQVPMMSRPEKILQLCNIRPCH